MIEQLGTQGPNQTRRTLVVDKRGRRLIVSTIDPADMRGFQTLVFEARPETDEPVSYFDLRASRHETPEDAEGAHGRLCEDLECLVVPLRDPPSYD